MSEFFSEKKIERIESLLSIRKMSFKIAATDYYIVNIILQRVQITH